MLLDCETTLEGNFLNNAFIVLPLFIVFALTMINFIKNFVSTYWVTCRNKEVYYITKFKMFVIVALVCRFYWLVYCNVLNRLRG